MSKIENCEEDRSNQKILVVTESPQISTIITSKLERDGLRVFQSSSGKESLKLIESFCPELMVIDSVLPDMSGYELVQKVRTSSGVATLPIFILLDLLQERSAKDFLNSGATEVLVKPFRPTELSKKIRKVLALKRE